ncbi:aminopeptidase P family protein [Brevibacillus laterosporus]|uniref:Aminopeptidase P family protein n=1 Tax=Brevibacillus laterosporus TaxID=1465 RepID=A0A502HBL0_BRELA|nr:M24 family metallopeptidase [Brevibacillus laterosporus]QDX92519.1 aminopeptidase P family protein [Brevibacillus laterosporus]TPG70826.1 aminopeptidase P family protein [Brevibacillus laterosporus]TPG80892.1 aminopeptidase P family protein [Brevibacillus laterosporus]
MKQSLEKRHSALRDAEKKAEELFIRIEEKGILRGGVTEKQVNREIYELAFQMFGIKKYWHKRIVRTGKNTLYPYRENPPDLTISDEDIIFLDFGPIFEEWEADFGRTFVLGNDPYKIKLQNDIAQAWQNGKDYFQSRPNITGSELFEFMCRLAEEYGWEYGGPHAGHLIGEFPHERIQGDEVENYIHSENKVQMREPDKDGRRRDWILEVHFIDRELEIGGFFEQLLTVE